MTFEDMQAYQNGTDGALVLDLEISTAERLRCLK